MIPHNRTWKSREPTHPTLKARWHIQRLIAQTREYEMESVERDREIMSVLKRLDRVVDVNREAFQKYVIMNTGFFFFL
jgi:hypothetical protein